MYEGFYSNIEDCGAYLARLHMDAADFRPDREHLDMLLKNHHRYVPFDNLNVWDKAELPSLNVSDLFKKIITDRRGGYCYEMNGLLEAALRTLGYDCYGVEIRIVRGRDFMPPFRHRGVVVVLDGKKMFCDVGLGFKFFPQAAEYNNGYNESGYKVECKDGICELWEKTGDGGEQKIIWYPDRPVLAVDFLNPNMCCSIDPASTFRTRLTAVIMTPEGYRKTLLCTQPSPRAESKDAPEFTINIKDGSKVLFERNGKGTEDMCKTLLEEFGIEYSFGK